MTIETPPPGPPAPPGPPVPPSDPYGSPYGGQPSPYSAGPPISAGDKNNVLAIVSLVLGIASYFTGFFLAIGAVITGHIALSQIKRTGGRGRGMAIAGLILGYASILLGVITVVGLIIFFAVIGVASNNINNSLAQNGFDDDFPTSQSTDEACGILLNEVSDSANALSNNFSELQTDPNAAITALQNLSDDFSTAEDQITNPDVLEAATEYNSDLDTMISDYQDYVADPTVGTDFIVSDAQDVQSDYGDITSVCS